MKLLHVTIECNRNYSKKLLFVGLEAEMLLYFQFSEADDVARNVLIFLTF